jgi:putative salt-induced outer membrane protein
MSYKSSIGLVLLPAVAFLNYSQAQAAETAPWKAEVELGVINTTGNTESRSINAKAMGEYNTTSWRHKANLESLVTSDVSGTSAERYYLAEKSDRKFTDSPSYVFEQIDYEADRFSGYTYRSTFTLGYGRTLVKRDDLTLDAEIGAGYRKSEESATNNIIEESIGRGGFNLDWAITSHSGFREAVYVEAGSEATITKSVTALKAQVNGNLATKLTYTIKNTSDVPVGNKKTDTETAFTLVYSF